MQYKMESKASKDVATHSLLPPSFEEACDAEKGHSACYHVHVNHSTGGTQTIQQTACCTDGSKVEEKAPLTDVPLSSEQLAMIYNKDVPPPYEADPSQKGVWSTETSKLHPGGKRFTGRVYKRYNLLCNKLIVALSLFVGLYVCFNGVTAVIENYSTAWTIRTVQQEAYQAVTNVPDVFNVPEEYEGKLIHVTGRIHVFSPLRYDECNISVRAVTLKRRIDLTERYQKRAEDIRHFEDPEYFWSAKWPTTRLGPNQICQNLYPDYVHSIQFDDDLQIADTVSVGSLILGHRLKEKFDVFTMIADKIIDVDMGQGNRVMYAAAGMSGTTYSFLGKLSRGVIEPFDTLDYFKIILQREGDVPARTMINDRVMTRLRSLQEENWWSYAAIGLGLLIPLIALVHYKAVVKAINKSERSHVMLSMPAE